MGIVAPMDEPLPERAANAPAEGEPIPSHYRWCFGCGGDHPTGLHMRLYAGVGLQTYGTFNVTDNHQGAPGLAHGGLLTPPLGAGAVAASALFTCWPCVVWANSVSAVAPCGSTMISPCESRMMRMGFVPCSFSSVRSDRRHVSRGLSMSTVFLPTKMPSYFALNRWTLTSSSLVVSFVRVPFFAVSFPSCVVATLRCV